MQIFNYSKTTKSQYFIKLIAAFGLFMKVQTDFLD